MILKKQVYLLLIFAVTMPALMVPAFAQKKNKEKKNNKENSLTELQRVNFDANFIEGMKYYLFEDYKSANALFERAYSIDPTCDGLNYQLAKINFFSGNNLKAYGYIQTALQADNTNSEYYIVMAKVCEALTKYDEAIKTYKKMIAMVPNSESYYYDMAADYIQLKDYDNAIKIYNKIEGVFGRSLELTRQKQQLYVKEGKTDQAIKEGQSLIDAYPNETLYKIAQAEFLYYNNRKSDAMQMLRAVLAKEPDNIKAHMLLADIYKFQNQPEKAFEEYKYLLNNPSVEISNKQKIIKDVMVNAKTDSSKARLLELSEVFIKSNPASSIAVISYADALFLNNRKKESWGQYCKSLLFDTNNYNVWAQVLSLDYEFGKYDSLTLHSEKAVESFPNQASLWFYKGMGYFNLKNYPKAIDALEESKKLAGANGELKTSALLMLGDSYNETKQYVKSDAAYEEVLKYDKNNDHALNNYSYYLSLRKEKLPEAKGMAERMLIKNPDEANYLDTYAWILYQMKDYEAAKKQLDKVIVTTKNGTILEHYGDVLYQLGNKASAIEYWKQAKDAGDASELINKKIADGKLYE